MVTHRPYPSDVSESEWQFVVPYLCGLLPDDAGADPYGLRDLFDALRWVDRSGAPWHYLPHDFPPWEKAHQQARRWMTAGCFEAIVHDVRAVLSFADGRAPEPPKAVPNGGTMLLPQSASRAGTNGHSLRNGPGTRASGSTATLGNLLAQHVKWADEQDRTQLGALAEAVREVTGGSVELVYFGQERSDGDGDSAVAAVEKGIALDVAKLPETKRGFVLLPRRWVVERWFDWVSRFRRLANDYERLPLTLTGLS
jgi:transposase